MKRTTLGDLANRILQLPKELQHTSAIYRVCEYGAEEAEDKMSYHYIQFLEFAEEDIEPRMIKNPSDGEERLFCTLKKGEPFLCDF